RLSPEGYAGPDNDPQRTTPAASEDGPETPHETMKRAKEARDFPYNTCPASRHAQMIGEALVNGSPYPMLTEEPEHCGQSILATVAALYKARRLAASGQGVDWQPIETAPKDGTRVLIAGGTYSCGTDENVPF